MKVINLFTTCIMWVIGTAISLVYWFFLLLAGILLFGVAYVVIRLFLIEVFLLF